MNKLILFIFLELFTIRNIQNYKKSVIKTSRDYVYSIMKKAFSYEDFRNYCYNFSVSLNPSEFSFVSNFLRYLKKIDIYTKE